MRKRLFGYALVHTDLTKYLVCMTVSFISNRSVHWNYCVLDEGHIIKNGKTKVGYLVTELP